MKTTTKFWVAMAVMFFVTSLGMNNLQAQESPRVMAMRLYASEFASDVRKATSTKNQRQLVILLEQMQQRAEEVEQENNYYTKSLYRRISQIGAQFPRTYRFAAVAAQRLGEYDPSLELEALNIVVPTFIETFKKRSTPAVAKPLIHIQMRIAWLSAQNAEEDRALIALDRAGIIAERVNMKQIVEPQIKAFKKELPKILEFANKLKPLKAKVSDVSRDEEAVKALFAAYFVERDEPASALPYVDPAKQGLIRIAYKPLGHGKPGDYLNLSRWYHDVAMATEDKDQKIAMLIRSSVYADEALSMSSSKSHRSQVAEAIRKLRLDSDELDGMKEDLKSRIGFTANYQEPELPAENLASNDKRKRPGSVFDRRKPSFRKDRNKKKPTTQKKKTTQVVRKVKAPDFRRPGVMAGEGASIFDF